MGARLIYSIILFLLSPFSVMALGFMTAIVFSTGKNFWISLVASSTLDEPWRALISLPSTANWARSLYEM